MNDKQKEKKQSSKSTNYNVDSALSFLSLIAAGVIIIVVAETINWYFGQYRVQNQLAGIWNALTAVHKNVLFWLQAHSPEGHDFIGLANNISSFYAAIGKLFPLVKPCLWILTYALIAGAAGTVITGTKDARPKTWELVAITTTIFILKLLTFANPNVNFLNAISVIAFFLNNYPSPFIVFFICYISICIGSEVKMFNLRNANDAYMYK